MPIPEFLKKDVLSCEKMDGLPQIVPVKIEDGNEKLVQLAEPGVAAVGQVADEADVVHPFDAVRTAWEEASEAVAAGEGAFTTCRLRTVSSARASPFGFTWTTPPPRTAPSESFRDPTTTAGSTSSWARAGTSG